MRNNRLKRLRKRTMREIQEDRKRFDKMYHPTLEPKRNLLKRAGLNPHVHTKIQLKKMTKTGLIRLVIKLEKFIVSHAYEMYKAKLPRLRTTRPQKRLLSEDLYADRPDMKRLKALGFTESEVKRKRKAFKNMQKRSQKAFKLARKTKRKKLTGAAKAKFLARMNRGRRKKGLKPIRSR